MNFSQLQERLRLEIIRRIERKVLTATQLALKAGLSQPHISNLLHNKRDFRIDSLDRVLAALELSITDLLPDRPSPAPARAPHSSATAPFVSHETAMFDAYFHPGSIIRRIPLPEGFLLSAEHGARPPARDRFAAVALTPAQAAPMVPVLRPGAVVVLDRHSVMPSTGSSTRFVYAVRVGRQMQFSYLSFERNLFVLRPRSLDFPVHVLPIPLGVTPSSLVVGRVCAIVLST